ncbi:MAG TPA: ammonium transporter [Microbacteriaceae bacterium]|nr:ammonium transporter [Microbacteriaceae bacterium]
MVFDTTVQALSALAPSSAPAAAEAAVSPAAVDSLWLLVGAGLVLLMTPGVAFFYGGMVRAKSVISMMMMSFGSMAVVGVLWVLYGYGFAFGRPIIPHVFGSADFGMASLLGPNGTTPNMSGLSFAGFQATFAIIAVALISGAIADRARFGAWLLFVAVWVSLVYFPVAYWVFNLRDGWIASVLHVNDFAGGTAVHIAAGSGALALTLVLGKRIGFGRGMYEPHNVPLTLLGAALLWFGWFGFNAGSEGAVDGTTALVWVNTLVAPAAAILGWLGVERLKSKRMSSIGAASGAVAGLVAITPACNVLTPLWAIVLGALAGAVCALAIDWKFRFGFDDSLDVVGIHMVGGIIGTLFVGVAGMTHVDGDPSKGFSSLLYGGSFRQLAVQAIAVVVVAVFVFVVTYLIGFAIQKTIGFRLPAGAESAGVDLAVHGEVGYALADIAEAPAGAQP